MGNNLSFFHPWKNKFAIRNQRIVLITLLIVFIIIFYPLVFKNVINTYDQRDETNCHYSSVQKFISDYPNIHFFDYNTATTPLYHLMLTFTGLYISNDIVLFRSVNFMFALLLIILSFILIHEKDRKNVFVLFFLLVLSPYVIGPAVRISTDNVALAGALALILFLKNAPINLKSNLIASVLILLTILVRQFYIWMFAYYFIIRIIQYKKLSIRNLLEIGLPLFIPLAGIAYFYFLWNGISQPQFQTLQNSGINFEVIIYAISIIGFFACFFFSWIIQIVDFRKTAIASLVIILAAFVFLSLFPVDNLYPIPQSSFHDRGGWLWVIISKFPNLFGIASLILVLFPMGVLTLFYLAYYFIKQKDYYLLLALLIWLIPYAFNERSYQRYLEPFIIITLAYYFSRIEIKGKWYHFILPAILIIFYVLTVVYRFFLT